MRRWFSQDFSWRWFANMPPKTVVRTKPATNKSKFCQNFTSSSGLLFCLFSLFRSLSTVNISIASRTGSAITSYAERHQGEGGGDQEHTGQTLRHSLSPSIAAQR